MSNDGKAPSDFDRLHNDERMAILYRLDERTERIDGRIERIDSRVDGQQKMLDNHDNRIQRNTTILNAITFGAGSLITGVLAKLGGFIRF